MFALLLYVQAADGSAGSTVLSEDSRSRSLSSSKAPGNSLQSTCTPATFSPETHRWVSSLFYVDSCEIVVQRWFRYTQEDNRTSIWYHKVAITLATWEQEVCKLLSQKDAICPGHCSITLSNLLYGLSVNTWLDILYTTQNLKLSYVINQKSFVYFLLGISPASNCTIAQFDAGEIPRRKYTIFKSRRKSEIKNRNHLS